MWSIAYIAAVVVALALTRCGGGVEAPTVSPTSVVVSAEPTATLAAPPFPFLFTFSDARGRFTELHIAHCSTGSDCRSCPATIPSHDCYLYPSDQKTGPDSNAHFHGADVSDCSGT